MRFLDLGEVMGELNNLSGSPTLFLALVEQKGDGEAGPAEIRRRDKCADHRPKPLPTTDPNPCRP